MRILITGASGMIGSALSSALLERGDSVVGLSRNSARSRERMPEVEWHDWQADADVPPPAPALAGIDAIVNLAGEPIDQRRTAEVKRRILASRLAPTRELAQSVARMTDKPGVVVSGSAVGYYGSRGNEVLDEEAEHLPSGFESEAVYAWEQAAEGFENVGVRLVKLRSGPVLHPSGGMLARLLPPFKLGVGGPVAGGSQYVSWIHIADEVGIILLALDNPGASGPINATAPVPVTNRELSKALGRVLRRPAVMPVPGFAMDLLYGRDLARTVKEGQRVVPSRALELGYRFQHPEIEEALEDLLRPATART